MSLAQYAVTVLGAAAIVWVLWYFVFSRTTAAVGAPGEAEGEGEGDGAQEVYITVKGGYAPDTIVVQAGRPVRLRFYRDETVDCSERLVLEHFGIDVPLPAFETTTVEFTPTEAGEFHFRCGRHVLSGLLVVEPATADRQPSASPHKFHA